MKVFRLLHKGKQRICLNLRRNMNRVHLFYRLRCTKIDPVSNMLHRNTPDREYSKKYYIKQSSLEQQKHRRIKYLI